MAAILDQYNDYVEVQSLSVDALKLTKPEDTANRIVIYNNFGISYEQLDNYDRARKNYQKALSMVSDIGHALTIENNIGVTYLTQKRYPDAATILEKAYNHAVLDTLPVVKARLANNLGYAKFKLGEAGAEELLMLSLQIRREQSDDVGAIASLLHLAEMVLPDKKNPSNTRAKPKHCRGNPIRRVTESWH